MKKHFSKRNDVLFQRLMEKQNIKAEGILDTIKGAVGMQTDQGSIEGFLAREALKDKVGKWYLDYAVNPEFHVSALDEAWKMFMNQNKSLMSDEEQQNPNLVGMPSEKDMKSIKYGLGKAVGDAWKSCDRGEDVCQGEQLAAANLIRLKILLPILEKNLHNLTSMGKMGPAEKEEVFKRLKSVSLSGAMAADIKKRAEAMSKDPNAAGTRPFGADNNAGHVKAAAQKFLEQVSEVGEAWIRKTKSDMAKNAREKKIRKDKSAELNRPTGYAAPALGRFAVRG